MNHVVVFSHGFGVKKDDRGLFTDIAKELDCRTTLFDYNAFDEENNTLTVTSLSEQAEKLKEVIEATREKAGDIDLVCHSQGCVVVALLKPQGIRKTIFLTAPAELTVDGMKKLFEGRDKTSIDIEGTSTLGRRDGSTTVVPSEYWKELDNINPISLYGELAEITKLVLINAAQDEVIGRNDFSELSSNIKTISLDANHDFTDKVREEVIEVVRKELAE